MDILTKLPLDLQEKVLEEYIKCEGLRALVRNYPVEFTMILNTEIMLRGELRKNDIVLSTKIWCDEYNFVRAHFDIYWSSWIGWSYNVKNVPLGYICERDCIGIVKKWKKAFYEFLKLNHSFGKKSFENTKCKGYTVESFSVPKNAVIKAEMNRLQTKKLAKIIKKAWFGLNVDQIKPLEQKLKTIDNQDDFDCPNVIEATIGRFRMDDSCPDLGSDFIRVPYTSEDLELIRDKMPFIYKCLEDNDELWSPRLEFSPGMKKYIKLYNVFNNSPEELPPPDEFNAVVQDIIVNDLEIGWYSLSYDYNSKYIVMPKLNELLAWCA